MKVKEVVEIDLSKLRSADKYKIRILQLKARYRQHGLDAVYMDLAREYELPYTRKQLYDFWYARFVNVELYNDFQRILETETAN